MPFSWINRDGKLIILARTSWLSAMGPLSVVLIIYLKQVGFSLIQSGIIIGAGLVGGSIYAVLTGISADAIGRRRILTYFTFARGVGGIALAFIGNFPLLATITFLMGAAGAQGGGGGLQSLAQATLTETAPAHRRTELYAMYNMFPMVGTALGTLAAGLPVILQNSLGMSELTSLRAMMLWYTFFNFVASLLSPNIEVSQMHRRWVNPLTLPSRRKIFTVAGLFTVERAAGALVVQSLVAYWFFDHFGVQIGSLAIIFFSANIGTAASFWIGAKLANRFGLINTMVFTHLPASFLLVVLPFVPEAWMAVTIWLAYSLTRRMAHPLRQSYAMAIVGSQERVAMATITATGNNASTAGGPPLATWLWSVASASVPFIASGVMQIGGDLLLYFKFRNMRPPEEAHRQAERERPTPLEGVTKQE